MIYALITLYYLNNIKIYANGLATLLGKNITDPAVTNVTTALNTIYMTSVNNPSQVDSINKYLYNYLLLGLISITCSFFGFAVRDTFKVWQMDLTFLIIVLSN